VSNDEGSDAKGRGGDGTRGRRRSVWDFCRARDVVVVVVVVVAVGTSVFREEEDDDEFWWFGGGFGGGEAETRAFE